MVLTFTRGVGAPTVGTTPLLRRIAASESASAASVAAFLGVPVPINQRISFWIIFLIVCIRAATQFQRCGPFLDGYGGQIVRRRVGGHLQFLTQTRQLRLPPD